MEIIQAQTVIHRDGWEGEPADIQDIGMLDDATFLLSHLRETDGASIALAMEPVIPADASVLAVRCQRMNQGRVSGTGTPAPLTVVLHQGEKLLLQETITPGGSWKEEHFGVPAAAADGPPLTVELLVPAGERQVAVSRLRLECRALVEVVAVEDSASDTQEPAEEPPACSQVASGGGACVLAPESVGADAVDPPAEDSASSAVVPPVKRKRARHKDGTYHADNPATPDANEAWLEE